MLTPTISPTFRALLNEVQFTRDILGAGATQIRRANYAKKSHYFLALTCLSTGLERLGKLCLILDHLIVHGNFPNQNQLKREIGHRINKIHELTEDLVQRRGLQLQFLQHLDNPVQLAALSCLHNFAEGDRYSNLDLLVGTSQASDPLAEWYSSVDEPLFQQCLSLKKQLKISFNANKVANMMGTHSEVLYISETGILITSLEEASYKTGVFEAVAPHRQLCVLQIIRYWVEVLVELQYLAIKQNCDIPNFSEVLAIFYNHDRYLKSRKTWERK